MPTIQEQIVAADRRGLVRKIQKALAMLAPTSVDLPASLYGTDGQLIDLAALGFLPVGIVTKDGYTFGREVETTEVDGLGYSVVRTDIDKVTRSVKFTPIETGRKHMYELTLGTDLSGVTMDPATGEVVFDEPDIPVQGEYRLIVLGKDGPADNEWIMGRGYGLVQMSESAESVWGGEDAVSQEITLSVMSDEDTGTPVRHYLAGTGPLRYAEDIGFTLAAA